MTLKIKTPPMPEQAYWGLDMHGSIVSGANNVEKVRGFAPGCSTKLFSEAQLAARDAQWLELVGPVVEALQGVIAWMDAPDASAFSDSQLSDARAALRAITEEQE